MEAIGTIEALDEPATVPARTHTMGEGAVVCDFALQREILLGVRVNDIPTMQIGCSQSNLVELVCGRLFTEGLVRGIDEIDALSICENSREADVYLRDREANLSRRAAVSIATCCTNNRTLNDFFNTGDELEKVTPRPWTDEFVFRLTAEFAKDDTSHRHTHGTHSAYLALLPRMGEEVGMGEGPRMGEGLGMGEGPGRHENVGMGEGPRMGVGLGMGNASGMCEARGVNGETDVGILCVREDIGRHNALDKAVGYGLMNGVDLSRCALFTSGRVPTDMIVKVIRAGIPLLVSNATTTDQSVRAARDYGLTLICNARPNSFDVLAAPLEARTQKR